MAYDPEARRKGNSALTIGLVALGLLGVGALAYVLTQPNNAETGPTTVVTTSPKTEVVEKEVAVPVPVPADSSPDTVIVQPAAPAASTTTTSSTTVTSQAAPRPAAPAQSAPSQSAPAPSTTNNTTINVEAPPAPSSADSSESTPATDESVSPEANTAPSSP